MILAMTEDQTISAAPATLPGFAIRDPYTMRLWWPDATTDPTTSEGAEK